MTKKQRRKARESGKLSRHHLYPKSLYGKDGPTVDLPWWKHQIFHKLFGLKNPQEALRDFIQTFLGGSITLQDDGNYTVYLPVLHPRFPARIGRGKNAVDVRSA